MPGAAGRIPSLANLSQQSQSLVMVSCLFSQGRKLRQREAEETARGQGDSGGDFSGGPGAKTPHSHCQGLGSGTPWSGNWSPHAASKKDLAQTDKY